MSTCSTLQYSSSKQLLLMSCVSSAASMEESWRRGRVQMELVSVTLRKHSGHTQSVQRGLPATHLPVLETICMLCHIAADFKIVKSELDICIQAPFH